MHWRRPCWRLLEDAQICLGLKGGVVSVAACIALVTLFVVRLRLARERWQVLRLERPAGA